VAYNKTLRNTKSPNQPIAPVDYDQRFQDQFSNALRLYFNEIDNFTGGVSQVVTGDGIVFPDGTLQTTAWEPSYIEAYDRTASISIGTTPALLIPNSFLPSTSAGITYNTTTGVFTFQYSGVYSLSIGLNIRGSTGNQTAYVYAQKNVGAGWVNTTNSGKAYKLTNGTDVLFTNPQAVYRTAGEQTRYYIYASSSGSTLVTQTLPTVTPTVYVPAIRIQYAGG
jgi:hypothetical protein